MANAKYLSDPDGIFYPISHAMASYDSKGVTVEERLNQVDQAIIDGREEHATIADLSDIFTS